MTNPKLAYMFQTEQENKHATNGVITDFNLYRLNIWNVFSEIYFGKQTLQQG